MPKVLTYRCPFCDRDARVGEPCPGCAALKKAKRTKSRAASRNEEAYDDDFNYEEFCKREFGKSPHHRTGLKWYWWCLAVIVLAAMAAAALWMG